jgi:hypothetical protein
VVIPIQRGISSGGLSKLIKIEYRYQRLVRYDTIEGNVAWGKDLLQERGEGERATVPLFDGNKNSLLSHV